MTAIILMFMELLLLTKVTCIEPLKCSSMLFIKKPCEKIKVERRKPFPLSRSIVAVPLGLQLFLHMQLMSGDEVFLKHTTEFQAKRVGTYR